MISVYALAVLVLSVPLMVVCSRFDPKRLLLGVIGLFLLDKCSRRWRPRLSC